LTCVLILALALQELAGNGLGESTNNSSEHAFTLLLNIAETPRFSEQSPLKSEYYTFVSSLKDKQAKWKNDHRTLEHLFYKVHQKYLKKYVPYQSFQALFDTGTYGCLTGTALYAFLLDELGYKYEIIETNYHMFLIVEVDDQRFLLESTDPFNGFEYIQDEINKRIAEAYLKNKIGGTHYTFSYDIYRSISYTELIGLQYYNTAINAYNQNNLSLSLYCLNEAFKFNKSERIAELLILIINSVDNPPAIEKVISNFDELSGLIASN
jgi:hypothetical protein